MTKKSFILSQKINFFFSHQLVKFASTSWLVIVNSIKAQGSYGLVQEIRFEIKLSFLMSKCNLSVNAVDYILKTQFIDPSRPIDILYQECIDEADLESTQIKVHKVIPSRNQVLIVTRTVVKTLIICLGMA